MSMKRLLELKNIVENNVNLSDKSNLELAVWGALLEDDEVPVKNFTARTLDESFWFPAKQKGIQGELLLTDKRLVFITDSENGKETFEMRYKEMDSFFTGADERDKSNGIIIIVSEGAYYTFFGLIRFGLDRWGKYVNDKIKEIS